MANDSIYDERARLIDSKFLGDLSPQGTLGLAEIEAELDRLEAPQAAQARERRAAELAALNQQLSDLKGKITNAKVKTAKIEKDNAPRRPQVKTAASR